MFIITLLVGGLTLGTIGSVEMSSSILPDVTVGSEQPSMGRVALTLMFVGTFGLFALFANVFRWDRCLF